MPVFTTLRISVYPKFFQSRCCFVHFQCQNLMNTYRPLPSPPTESQEEDGDIEVEEAEGEENDRPYNLRQRKTVERYQAPPIGEELDSAHTVVLY